MYCNSCLTPQLKIVVRICRKVLKPYGNFQKSTKTSSRIEYNNYKTSQFG